jgi:hypothetical protein
MTNPCFDSGYQGLDRARIGKLYSGYQSHPQDRHGEFENGFGSRCHN